MKKILIPFFLAPLASCSSIPDISPPKGADPCFVAGIDTCNIIVPAIIIDDKKTFQTIEDFGGSDCWTTKFIGKWTNEAKKNQIADLLFSMDTLANGNPIGVGMSAWRFNVGAGSFEQGAASGIPDDYRREECFLDATGNYDWTKQAGQKWFLGAAKQRGVKDFIAFTISPPVQYTSNNKAYGLGNTTFSLKNNFEPQFSEFLVNVMKHFNNIGYPMKYISPINEPQWDWGKTPSQEGSGASNASVAKLVRVLGPALKNAGLNTEIAIAEAGRLDHLTTSTNNTTQNQIANFYNPTSANYIGNVPNLAKVISGHSYFTTCPDQTLLSVRQNVHNNRNSIDPSLRVWQTEFGILGNICDIYKGFPKNVGIDYGLYVAKVLHHDLSVANVTAWQWWLSVSTYDYSDALVYINDINGGFDREAMKTDGVVSDSKQLWCFGNYSRFIRPGMVRVDAKLSDVPSDLIAASGQMVSAYKDVNDKKLVIVIVNMSPNAISYKVDKSITLASNTVETYTTSSTANLEKNVQQATRIAVAGKSVVTIVAKL